MKKRKQLTLYIVLLFLAVLTMYILWLYNRQAHKPFAARDYAEIKAEGVLRIITEYSPSGYYVSGDTIEGFQYELSQAIARISGLEVQTQLEMNLANSFQALDENRCDVIAQNLPITTEQREQYLFTDPVVMNRQVLVQRTAEANDGQPPLRNQIELGGKTVHVPQGSPALLRLRHLENEIGDTICVVEDPTYSMEQLAIMVAKGDIDFAVSDRQSAVALGKDLPEIDIDTDISFTQLQAWAVRKSSPVLVDSLNAWLFRIRQSGEYDRIYGRYY